MDFYLKPYQFRAITLYSFWKKKMTLCPVCQNSLQKSTFWQCTCSNMYIELYTFEPVHKPVQTQLERVHEHVHDLVCTRLNVYTNPYMNAMYMFMYMFKPVQIMYMFTYQNVHVQHVHQTCTYWICTRWCTCLNMYTNMYTRIGGSWHVDFMKIEFSRKNKTKLAHKSHSSSPSSSLFFSLFFLPLLLLLLLLSSSSSSSK